MLRVASIITMFLVLAICNARAQQNPDWTLLGEQSVALKVNHDVVNVGQTEDWYQDRWFRALHILPERMDIYLISICRPSALVGQNGMIA